MKMVSIFFLRRYAASQYLMSDLVKLCEDYLEHHLTYKNGLTLLEQASAYNADDFKKKIYKVIKNRYSHVLSSPEVQRLEIDDLISLLKLYKVKKLKCIMPLSKIRNE